MTYSQAPDPSPSPLRPPKISSPAAGAAFGYIFSLAKSRRGRENTPHAGLAERRPPEHAWPMNTERCEHFPHRADIGVRGVGPSKAAAFAQAAVALTAAITDPGAVVPREAVAPTCRRKTSHNKGSFTADAPARPFPGVRGGRK